MKKVALFSISILMPLAAMASRLDNPASYQPKDLDIPAHFSMTGETKTLEWGCPIDNEQVEFDNKKAVLNRLISECLEQVSRAAEEKPEVAAVLQASVIAPNVFINDQGNVNGTIFLQTVVSLVKSPQ
jgi:hypothetical protein